MLNKYHGTSLDARNEKNREKYDVPNSKKSHSHPRKLLQEEVTIEDLLKYIKGPDFPTGGSIYDITEIKNAYITQGRGKIVIGEKQKLKKSDTENPQSQLPNFRIKSIRLCLLQESLILQKRKRLMAFRTSGMNPTEGSSNLY